MSGKTISEKIFERHSGKSCKADDIVIAKLDFVMAHDANRPLVLDVFRRMGGKQVFDPTKMAYVFDHYTPAPSEVNADIQKTIRSFCSEQKIRLYENEGICHQLIPERGHAVPGDLIIGSDSHTCTYGALNCFATGVGSTDLAAGMLTGSLWFKVPKSIKFSLKGTLPHGTFSKDLMLFLIGRVSADGASYKAVEFTGEAIGELSIEARMTISNMAVEMGAKAGIMEADDRLLKWVEGHTSKVIEPVQADEDAVYDAVYDFDVHKLSPQIARPHRVDTVSSIEELGQIPIHQANLVSCTNGRLEDLEIAASILKDKKVHPDVRFIIVPASRRVLLEAMGKGIMETLVEAGGILRHPSCAGCSSGAAFGTPGSGETVISSANRNFKGRLGNPKASIYLASPATVAASVLEGRIADCRKYL